MLFIRFLLNLVWQNLPNQFVCVDFLPYQELLYPRRVCASMRSANHTFLPLPQCRIRVSSDVQNRTLLDSLEHDGLAEKDPLSSGGNSGSSSNSGAMQTISITQTCDPQTIRCCP